MIVQKLTVTREPMAAKSCVARAVEAYPRLTIVMLCAALGRNRQIGRAHV